MFLGRALEESRMRRVLCITCLLSAGAVVSSAGQQIEPAFAQWEPSSSLTAAQPTAAHDTVPVARRDYRYEGVAFGGILFGGLGAYVGSRLGVACPTVPGVRCEPDRLGNAVALGVISAALGGAVGYLVGRFSAKPPDPGPGFP